MTMSSSCSERLLGVKSEALTITVELPEDLFTPILLNLPVKSLIRFRSTCKTWNALIRSPSFAKSHTQLHLHSRRPNRNNEYFFQEQGNHRNGVALNPNPLIYAKPCCSTSLVTKIPKTPLYHISSLLKSLKSLPQIRSTLTQFGFDKPISQLFEHNLIVMGPLTNGIYCIVHRVYARTSDFSTYSYPSSAICNPVTGDFKLVEPPHVYQHRSLYPFNDRSYAEHVLSVKYHYGFVKLVDDYKIIMIIQKVAEPSSIVFVYSSRRGTWESIPAFEAIITQDADFLPNFASAVLNGCCHWTTSGGLILRFDMNSEVFGFIPGPPYDDEEEFPPREGVFVLNDQLATIHCNWSGHKCKVQVWVMEESWRKMVSCTIQLGCRLQKFLGISFSNGVSIEKLFFQVKREVLLSYDCCCRRVVETRSVTGRRLHWVQLQHEYAREMMEEYIYVDDDDDEYGESTWECLTTMKRGWRRSFLTYWKPIGLSSYTETLQPVELD